MSILTIRISASTNPHTPEFFRLYSAFNSRPTSRISLYKTGDIHERDLIAQIQNVVSIFKPDSVNVIIDQRWGTDIVSADTSYLLEQSFPAIVREGRIYSS